MFIEPWVIPMWPSIGMVVIFWLLMILAGFFFLKYWYWHQAWCRSLRVEKVRLAFQIQRIQHRETKHLLYGACHTLIVLTKEEFEDMTPQVNDYLLVYENGEMNCVSFQDEFDPEAVVTAY